jgi:hypothetical protein
VKIDALHVLVALYGDSRLVRPLAWSRQEFSRKECRSAFKRIKNDPDFGWPTSVVSGNAARYYNTPEEVKKDLPEW